jgi:hypothetical protein
MAFENKFISGIYIFFRSLMYLFLNPTKNFADVAADRNDVMLWP